MLALLFAIPSDHFVPHQLARGTPSCKELKLSKSLFWQNVKPVHKDPSLVGLGSHLPDNGREHRSIGQLRDGQLQVIPIWSLQMPTSIKTPPVGLLSQSSGIVKFVSVPSAACVGIPDTIRDGCLYSFGHSAPNESKTRTRVCSV